MKRLLILFAVTMATLSVCAQRKITGTVVDNDTKEAMVMTTVRLLKSDSSLVKGVVTSETGAFSVQAPSKGNYILRITSVGYKDVFRNVTIENKKDVALGAIAMKSDAIMLEGATVTKNLTKVTVKADTFIYNAGAYRTPEGSVVEELVKRLPGAQVDDNGKITINGKEVKKILVDGKEFMTGDTKTAMKNLPTSIIEKIKAYDEKSDLARVSGIDDGNEQTVLDFGIKRGMNRGFLSNFYGGIGTEDRYTGRAFVGSFNSDLKIMGMGNANNVNDRGFGGGRGRFGGGGAGLQASKMAGVNVNYDTKKLKLSGSIRWNHSDGDTYSRSSSENFVSTVGSFSNNTNNNYSRGNSWNGQMRLEWMPDTMTNIMFRPSFSYSTNDGRGKSASSSFNQDPYLYVTDPLNLSLTELAMLRDDSVIINSRSNRSLNYSENKNFGGMLQFNRRLGNNGRNLTLRADANYSEGESKSSSTNDVTLYQLMNYLGTGDSTYQTNRFNLTPTKNWNYSARFTYSEPILPATFLQFSYQFRYQLTKSDRSTYDFSNPPYNFDFGTWNPKYRNWDDYFSYITGDYNDYRDEKLSRFSKYENYIHEIELMLRVIRPAYNFNVGVNVIPQKNDFTYRYQNIDTVTSRNITNITPTANFRWKISNVSQLRFTYRGNTGHPSMTDLLPITDNSDPLNISTGNPGLKPSFTNNMNLRYNNYWERYMTSLYAFLNFSTTSNSVARKVTYNPETGGRLTRPENINGNWNISGNFTLNTALDTLSTFNVNTSTDIRYANNVGYVSLNRNSDSQKNYTRDLSISERLGGSYRNEWIEFEVAGSVRYNHAENELQPNANLDTWMYTYGFNTRIDMPWGTQLATDLNMNSRRGFSDESVNTNELIWNVQVSQHFLKKTLSVSLQFHDLLRELSNFSRNISAMGRTDTWNNSINSYAMLTVNYRLNIFGGRQAREGMQEGGPGMRGGRGGRGGFGGGGMRGGGFGGPRF